MREVPKGGVVRDRAEAMRVAVDTFEKVVAVFGDQILFCALAYAQTDEGQAILERWGLSVMVDVAEEESR